jgi:D-glycero-alpha-D-manno-heptose-7-phosphate kinase
MNIKLFIVSKDESIRTALEKIEGNKLGTIFISDDNDVIVGMATDGDIRRGLLGGLNLEQPIKNCCNKDFVRVNIDSDREQILKLFDTKIRVIPVLNAQGVLSNVYTRDNLPQHRENRVYTRAKSPVRISFGGGGSDLTHYFVNNNGAVINATISLFSHATLFKRNDSRVIVESGDLNARLEADSLQEALSIPGSFGLIQSVLKTIGPDFGFELYLYSDFPMKSGLGGSAVVASSIFGCFNEYRIDKWSNYEIAELAYQAERLSLGIAGGWQDQYATIFGGLNFMEFKADQNLIHPLKLNSDILNELEESLILCDTETTHESGNVHEDQKAEMSKTDIRLLVEKNVELTYSMRNMLLRGQLMKFAEALDLGWQYKKQFSSKITTTSLDEVYNHALANGAIGGKLLGAGGGGFFLFFVPANKKNQLINAMAEFGKRTVPFRFEQEGLRSWSMREHI